MEPTLIEKTAAHIRKQSMREGTGHDWFHVERVRKLALRIGRAEKADLDVISLAALLHDIADHKFNNNDLSAGPIAARKWLLKIKAEPAIIEKVVKIVGEVSYKGAGVATPVSSVEAAAVQDADRLDAMGAVGIARAFAYGGSKNRLLHNPTQSPSQHDSFEAYSSDEGTTINHFYEKLLLLKDRMNTSAGKALAEERHSFMIKFLEQFFKEWQVD